MAKRLVICFVLLNLVAFSFIVYRNQRNTTVVDTRTAKIAANLENAHIMGRDNYVKLNGIVNGMFKNHQISDRDFTWLLRLNKDNSLAGSSASTESARHTSTLIALEAVATCTKANDSKKKALYEEAMNALNSRDVTGIDKICGMRILVAVGNRQSVSFILPLLDSPKKEVRQTADWALKQFANPHDKAF